MKRIISVLLLCIVALSLAACGSEGPAEGSPGFSVLFGNWANDDKSYELKINDVGQVWYFSSGEQLFRGYLEEIELSEDDPRYEYFYRYDLYSDAGEFMMSYYCDTENLIIFEENTDGEIVDQFEYIGEFSLD